MLRARRHRRTLEVRMDREDVHDRLRPAGGAIGAAHVADERGRRLRVPRRHGIVRAARRERSAVDADLRRDVLERVVGPRRGGRCRRARPGPGPSRRTGRARSRSGSARSRRRSRERSGGRARASPGTSAYSSCSSSRSGCVARPRRVDGDQQADVPPLRRRRRRCAGSGARPGRVESGPASRTS